MAKRLWLVVRSVQDNPGTTSGSLLLFLTTEDHDPCFTAQLVLAFLPGSQFHIKVCYMHNTHTTFLLRACLQASQDICTTAFLMLPCLQVKDWGGGEPADLGELEVESYTPDLYADHSKPFYEQLARRLEDLQVTNC